MKITIFILLYNKKYSCDTKSVLSLYIFLYNDDKYFYYIRRRIMTINILVIQEDV